MARKKPHDEHQDESWLLPYSDLMTLLLALFIVLFAASNVDAQKFAAIREAFANEFATGGSKLPDGGTGLLPGGTDNTPGPDISFPPKPTAPTPSGQEIGGPGEPDPDLQALFDSINGYISANDLSGNMALKISQDGVLITLSSDIWFDSGSADVSSKMRGFAVTLSNLLSEKQKEHPINIIITGHTDNKPIISPNARFKSNWHVSVARAVNFMDEMISTNLFDPRVFSARGYGEYSPIDTNDTEEGRQHNRRVEVLVSLKPGEAASEGADEAANEAA
jgi:chemotaxis protein MotB